MSSLYGIEAGGSSLKPELLKSVSVSKLSLSLLHQAQQPDLECLCQRSLCFYCSSIGCSGLCPPQTTRTQATGGATGASTPVLVTPPTPPFKTTTTNLPSWTNQTILKPCWEESCIEASTILEPQRAATQLQLGLNLQGMRGGLGATSPASAMAANGVCLPTEPLVLYPTALPPALCVAPQPTIYPLHTLVCCPLQ